MLSSAALSQPAHLKSPPRARLSAGATYLKLAMSQPEAHRLLGTPQTWVVESRFLRTGIEYAAAVKVYGIESVHEIYYRRAPSNRYQVQIGYGFDESESRLNPKLRVWRFWINPDRVARTATLIKDFPEIGYACQTGCLVDTSVEGFTTLYAIHPSESEVARFRLIRDFRRVREITAVVGFAWEEGSSPTLSWTDQTVADFHMSIDDEVGLGEHGLALLQRARMGGAADLPLIWTPERP